MARRAEPGYRRRRHAGVLVAFALLAAAVAALWPGLLPGGLRTVPTGLAAVVVAGLGAALPWRGARRAFLGFVAAAPVGLCAAGVAGGGTVGWATGAAIWFGLGLVGWQLLAGRMFAGARPGSAPVLKARAVSRLTARELWDGLVPAAGRNTASAEAVARRAEPGPARPGELLLTLDRADGRALPVRLVVIEAEAPYHLRAAVLSRVKDALVARADKAVSGPGGLLGFVEMSVVDLGDRRLVLVRGEPPGLSFAEATEAWLDDRLGRELDRRVAGVEARAAGRTGPAG